MAMLFAMVALLVKKIWSGRALIFFEIMAADSFSIAARALACGFMPEEFPSLRQTSLNLESAASLIGDDAALSKNVTGSPNFSGVLVVQEVNSKPTAAKLIQILIFSMIPLRILSTQNDPLKITNLLEFAITILQIQR
jgi:hypothetical protein